MFFILGDVMPKVVLLVAELVWEMLAVRVMFQLTRKVETWGVPS